ncbi:MAG: hypothetical protein ABIA04_04695 [Pseudomonadota bacterium]
MKKTKELFLLLNLTIVFVFPSCEVTNTSIDLSEESSGSEQSDASADQLAASSFSY